MADYYNHFSVGVQLRTAEECHWIDAVRDAIRGAAENSIEPSEDSAALDKLEELGVSDAEAVLQAAFENHIIRAPAVGADYGAIVYSGPEGGDVNAATILIESLLRRFGRDDEVVLHWASTCSGPRPGAFYGGTVLITRWKSVWCDTQEQLQWCREELKRGV